MAEGPPLAARGLKLRQLQLIVDVADTGQVVAAAQRLNMTQPAASRMLAELEHLLGVKLTARHPRGLNLTPAGARLAELARGILREIDTAAVEVRDIAGGKAAAFRFLDALGIVLISNNLGDAKSLITHPATTTHQRLSPEQRAVLGIGDGLVRLSLGLEDPADLEADILGAAQLERTVKPWVEGKTVKKALYVPGKLVNFVVA